MAGFRERLTEFVEDRTGLTIAPREKLELLEASDTERRALQRELDLLAYTALDYVGGQPQELKAVERRKLAQKARIVWMRDPLAGAAVDLMNDFTFGRGLSKPKANDKAVQTVLDEAWDDPDNQEVLTSLDAQVRLGTDLSLQANLFLKVFDDGDDGKVKLSLLKNDLVETVVRDPEVPQRILWFVCNEDPYIDWDYKTDAPVVDIRSTTTPKKVYYPHWRNVDLMMEEVEKGARQRPNMPEPDKVGEAKIFHIAINRTSDMALGHPPMDRLLRWFNAYNRFMDARVDVVEATAAFVMKRKVKGTPTQLTKMATQALSRRSSLGSARDPDADRTAGPGAASVITENESVEHEAFKLESGASDAKSDAQMLRANVSAGTRFPQSYYGDASDSNLATATSLELPVLKAVESRQEKFESAVRFFCDRVIERAVDTGVISAEMTAEELAQIEADKEPTTDPVDANASGAGSPPIAAGTPPPMGLQAAHEDAEEDEEATQRDLSYEFSMPSPLKRMMTDLISAIGQIASTFDPNNTNLELSRTLLGVALGEGLELEDPQGAVDKIFPPGYEDPAIKAAQAQAVGQPEQEFGPDAPTGTGADGQQHGSENPYGAPGRAQPAGAMGITEAKTLGRGGKGEVVWIREARVRDLAPETKKRLERRTSAVAEDFPTVAK
jgi:hypothetical protein